MQWTLLELANLSQVSFDEDIEVSRDTFAKHSLIDSVEDVHIDGTGYFQEDPDTFYVALHVTGTMICPDAITNELIEVDLDANSNETYAFEEIDDEDARVVNDGVVDLLPAVIDLILMEVPMQATLAKEGEYPHGDGWRIITEEEYQESRKDRIDPRLAKLKQFKDE